MRCGEWGGGSGCKLREGVRGGLGCLLWFGVVDTRKCVLRKWVGSGGLNENRAVLCCC